METKHSFIEGYITADEARAILNEGASHIRVQVNIVTTESGDKQYEILAHGAGENKKTVGAMRTLCPSPCPTFP